MKLSRSVAIINCGIGNIGSVCNALEYIQIFNSVLTQGEKLKDFDAAILPGVGSFDSAIRKITDSNFKEPILEFVSSGKPILGICVGMQVFFDRSDEGQLPGLGLIPGQILSLDKTGIEHKTTHVGFNEVRSNYNESPFLNEINKKDFYFTHSYAADQNITVSSKALTNYNGNFFTSAIVHNNVYGVQFHPEKSGKNGLDLIKEFVKC